MRSVAFETLSSATVAMVTLLDLSRDQGDLENVARRRPDVGEDLLGGRLVQVDSRDGCFRAVENDVFRLLDVDSGRLDPDEDLREYADSIIVPHDHQMGGGRLLREVDDVRRAAGLRELADD